MSRTTKHQVDYSPVGWLIGAFAFGLAAGMLLLGVALVLAVGGASAQAAETADNPSTGPADTRAPLTTETTAAELPRRAAQKEQAEPEEPEAPVLTSIGVYTVTAYCPCQQCCGKAETDPLYGITATGTTATEGRTIAVDPGVIPYGSVVYFEGPDGCIGGYVAEDCGGAVRGDHIDLYCADHETALAWGVREMEVYICE